MIRDVPKASRILQAAVDAGANSVWSVSFGIDDTKMTVGMSIEVVFALQK